MNSKKTICIISQSHLCKNPRVVKEATALASQGYMIYIVNTIYSKSLASEDAELISGINNITILSVSDLSVNSVNTFIDKVLYKFGRWSVRYLELETVLSLGYGSFRYLRFCKKIAADLYICHQELATHIGKSLIRSGAKVGFDFEDWYSEDLLESERKYRPLGLLRASECFALKNGAFCYTTSHAMASAMSKTYKSRKPSVIYNVFPSTYTFPIKNFDSPLKLFWFSQTIGRGRGLEEFIAILSTVNSAVELHLLGNVDEVFRLELRRLLKPPHILHFHILISPQLLPRYIQQFDIGLALEMTQPLNTNLTISNKYFQYIQAGLPVILTETVGQAEAFDLFTPGFKLPLPLNAITAAALNKWLESPLQLLEARNKAIDCAKKTNWEMESERLIDIIKNAVEQ